MQDEAAKEIAEVFREVNDDLLERLATKEELKKEIKELELALRKEIAEAKTSIIIWVAGMMLAQTATIVAVFIKFMGK